MKILAILLTIVSVVLNLRHGWGAFQTPDESQLHFMSNLGLSTTTMPYFGVFSIIVGLMLLFPQTFFIGNVLNAITIVLIMALSLHAGDVKTALIEIPFLLLPLCLIWLKYPFAR